MGRQDMIKPYYEHAGITIYHGDCLEIMPELDKIDLVLTDPPFNFCASGGGMAKRRGYIEKINKSIGTDFKPAIYLEMIDRLMNPLNSYFFCSKDILCDYISWAQELGYGFNVLTWHKTNPIPLINNTFLPDTEYIVYIRRPGATFNSGLPLKTYKKWQLTSIFKLNGHPTPKPLGLMEPYLLISSTEESIIVDPFMGSGTTLIDAKRLNRKAIGIDITEKYCEIAAKRLQQEVFQFNQYGNQSSIR